MSNGHDMHELLVMMNEGNVPHMDPKDPVFRCCWAWSAWRFWILDDEYDWCIDLYLRACELPQLVAWECVCRIYFCIDLYI